MKFLFFCIKEKNCFYGDEEAELRGICGIFQTIARITFQSGEIFDINEYLYTGQTTGIDVGQESKLTGFITVLDTEVGEIDTPNGKVVFVEFIGATDAELLALKNKKITVKELYEKLGTDVTDYKRSSLV